MDLKKVRLELLKDLIRESKKLSIKELSEKLGVSEITIRRDISILQSKGNILLDRGFVIYNEMQHELIFNSRIHLNVEGKAKIAQLAFDRIKSGDVIALDLGSTTLELAKLIAEKSENLTVFTSSLQIANVLVKNEKIDVYIIPGKVRNTELSICGSLAIELINKLHFDLFFMSVAGIKEGLLYEYIIEESEVKKSFMKQSKRIIVLADYTKFGKTALIKVCNESQVSEIISDRKLDGTR
ncbi:DeoR/GlpR family DNA-binding transcription regulator [Ureibacillus sp. GCM10028918]|uniref:DeoR/GlpR family DNA-binding transcription regulator n=1 Tax=Ureibacillus sp. GCM10028918 TaxID=3273429 RepID=UPI00361B3C40